LSSADVRPAAPRRSWWPLLAAALGVALARALAFVQDDAFISFLYARNLVEGRGLTWFGERVEGYTDFLWVVWIALGLRLGADPVVWTRGTGLAALAVTVLAVCFVAGRIFAGARTATLAVAVLLTNFSFLCWATGGLETMAQTALVCLLLALHLRDRRGRPGPVAGAALASALAGAALLLRLDSAIPVAVVLAFEWRTLGRAAAPRAARAALALPLAALVGGWLAWKLSYYGQLLPNSFAAKVRPTEALALNGLAYLGRFLHWYRIWPLLVLGALVALALRRRPPAALAAPALLLALWSVYVVAVGGDFMEFRFLVPVFPCLALLLAWALEVTASASPRLRLSPLVAVGLLAAASARYAVSSRGVTADATLDSIPALATFYGAYPDGDWSRIGSGLAAALERVPAVIATDAVGAIPYFSRLPTVDLLGLNDRETARHGTPAAPGYPRPGHRRHATLAHLVERRVQFVLGHPTLVPRHAPERRLLPLVEAWWSGTREAFGDVPAARIVLVPIDEHSSLICWYLVRTPALDRRIAERGWPLLELR
jgi:arabinofuranosyltransferase